MSQGRPYWLDLLDYGDILYDEPENATFQNKFKKFNIKDALL